MTYNVRYAQNEHEIVTALAVQCPRCEQWIAGKPIASNRILYDIDIDVTQFKCPLCNNKFGNPFNDCVKYAAEDNQNFYENVYKPKKIWAKE